MVFQLFSHAVFTLEKVYEEIMGMVRNSGGYLPICEGHILTWNKESDHEFVYINTTTNESVDITSSIQLYEILKKIDNEVFWN